MITIIFFHTVWPRLEHFFVLESINNQITLPDEEKSELTAEASRRCSINF